MSISRGSRWSAGGVAAAVMPVLLLQGIVASAPAQAAEGAPAPIAGGAVPAPSSAQPQPAPAPGALEVAPPTIGAPAATAPPPPGAPATADGSPPATAPAPAAVPVWAFKPEAAGPARLSPRPRFLMSAAVGISIDNHGIGDGRNVVIPSFAIQGGIGDGFLGFEARLFASEAAGRFSSPNPTAMGTPVADVGADRQAVDLLLAVRPFARGGASTDESWTAQFARAATADVGVAAERVSVGTQATLRPGVVVGAHVDLPIVKTGDGSELRVTVAVRRMLGRSESVAVGTTPGTVGDSKVEAFSGLTVVF